MENLKMLESLKSMGIEEKPAAIYLSLLKRPKMTPSQIARESGVKRATCYEHLDALLSRDFVTREPQGKRMFYSAVNPHKVFREFQKKIAHIHQDIEQMSHIHNQAVNKPRVLFYEGKREIKNIYDDLFRTVGDVYSIFPPATFFERFTEEDYDEFDKSISKYALKSRDLFVVDRHYKKLQEIREKNGAENKFSKRLPPSFTSNVDVLIYSDKVALISLRDLSAIVIENKDIADLFKNLHNFVWKSL